MTNVGKKIAAVVQSFLATGTHPDVQKLRADKRIPVLRQLVKIFGVGVSLANHWYEQYFVRSVGDCVLRVPDLTPIQKLWIKHFDELTAPMTRAQVESIVAVVRKALKELDDGAFSEIVGGYRRGKEKNGDVDLLVSHPSLGAERGLLAKLLEKLTAEGIYRYS